MRNDDMYGVLRNKLTIRTKPVEGGQWVETDAQWGYGDMRAPLPRILALMPLHPKYGARSQTWDSVRAAVRKYEGPIDWVISDGDNPYADGHENIVYQHNKARSMALEGGYDALLSIEADMLLPEDTVQRLVDCDADVAYGLYVWRHRRKRWSAYTELGLFGGTSINIDPGAMHDAWGKVIEVAGMGMGCTLIDRDVLEAIEFRLYDGDPDDWLVEQHAGQMAKVGINPYRPRRGAMHDDYLFALDVAHYGFTQRCDLGLVCGHIDDDGVLWPDPDAPERYRREVPDNGRGDST